MKIEKYLNNLNTVRQLTVKFPWAYVDFITDSKKIIFLLKKAYSRIIVDKGNNCRNKIKIFIISNKYSLPTNLEQYDYFTYWWNRNEINYFFHKLKENEIIISLSSEIFNFFCFEEELIKQVLYKEKKTDYFFLHGATVEKDNWAAVLCAAPTSGKSTFVKRLLEKYNYKFICDDFSAILVKKNKTLQCYNIGNHINLKVTASGINSRIFFPFYFRPGEIYVKARRFKSKSKMIVRPERSSYSAIVKNIFFFNSDYLVEENRILKVSQERSASLLFSNSINHLRLDKEMLNEKFFEQYQDKAFEVAKKVNVYECLIGRRISKNIKSFLSVLEKTTNG